jgi:hypothetical protein
MVSLTLGSSLPFSWIHLPIPHFQRQQDSRAAAVGKSKVQVTITKEMINQIFAERPHVKRAFDKVNEEGKESRYLCCRFPRSIKSNQEITLSECTAQYE